MNIWNYIGELFIFRWLFGKFKKSVTEHDAYTKSLGTSIDSHNKYPNDSHNKGIAYIDNAVTVVGDSLIDDSGSSDDCDDLDIFMRNNNGDNRSCLHHGGYDGDYNGRGRYSGHQDWNSKGCSQSYDDFHHEQDDYDMMDDDF